MKTYPFFRHKTAWITLLIALGPTAWSLGTERPFIWATAADRAAILEKIESQEWARSIYTGLLDELREEVNMHRANPDAYLRQLPFDWENAVSGKTPPFTYTRHTAHNFKGVRRNLDNATDEEMANALKLMRFLDLARNGAIAYFLTGEEQYARLATDILSASIKGILQLEPSDWRPRGGWLFPDDILKESRAIGQTLPVIYDFIAPYLSTGGKPYDIGRQEQIEFPHELAQQVFRTYADLVLSNGMINSNHPVLESPCLVYNALALEDAAEREKYVGYFLTKNTSNQDSLKKVAGSYQEEGDIWPETSQYLNHVAALVTRLMLVLGKYDPSLDLAAKYQNILLALPVLDSVVYPNGEIIRWGDGHRYQHAPYEACEEAYLLAKAAGLGHVTDKLGPVLKVAFARGAYQRRGSLALLWYEGDYQDYSMDAPLPRTDRIPHAGIFLQRNPSGTGDPADGLMCFVGGAHMVHGHAEGMNIELYGRGQVLGVDNGRGRYAVDVHENYSRLFAAHNTVIVNGNSRSSGGWVDLGINTVELVTMEPMPGKEALSPLHSFTQTRFEDDKGDLAEATQERTLAIIRTSDTTGYYVDVFRSKSRLPNEFHDYLYHNIGDQLEFENEGLILRPDPDRYMANASLPWRQNQQYRHPGWHLFREVESSSPYSGDVRATFSTGQLDGPPLFMAVHLPGFDNREYTRVMAPRTFEAPHPYDRLPTPTLVIRKHGEAWDSPFVAVYEPYSGSHTGGSVQSVEKLEQDGVYKGLKVVSQTASGWVVQYVITLSTGGVFQDAGLGIHFEGTFAVITTTGEDQLQSLYIGQGKSLRYGEITLESGPSGAAYQVY